MNAGSSFEYDTEDTEDTETFEAVEDTEGDNEDVEANDEDTEAAEANDEGFALKEDTESDVEDTEDESTDEDAGEAYISAAAQLRADQDRNRRAQWARQIAADQRLEAQRAASTQRSITDQIRSIRGGGQPSVYSVGSLQGAGVVTAVLPNGRRSRMQIIPSMAPISEVNRLRSVVLVNERRQSAATAKNSRAIAALASTQANAVRKLTAQQLKSDRDLSKRLVEGDNRLDRRITKELRGGNGVLDKHGKRFVRMLRRQRTRSLMNSVLLATSAPFFAAYGDRSNPFSKNNLILTGSLLGWLAADDLVDMFAGNSRGWQTAADIWSYAAPVGNGATAFFLFDKEQHERFVSGTTVIDSTGTATVNLDGVVGTDSFADFKTHDHMALATIIDPAASGTARDVRASVGKNGFLTLVVDPAPGGTATVTVGWIVDTSPTPSVAPSKP